MKSDLAYIAISLYVVIILVLMFTPKRWLRSTAKKDFGATDAEWNRKDNLGYYRLLFMIGGFATIAIVLILKYAFF